MWIKKDNRLAFSVNGFASRGRRKAQATLELSISIFLMLLLLVASARIFVWLSSRIVQRHSDYERTAVYSGSVEPWGWHGAPPDLTPWIVDENNAQDYPKLDIFENWSE
jgi:hypothetical protein